MNNLSSIPNYIYTYACREDEQSLCQLELRSLFGMQPPANLFKSTISIDPSRSPFIKERVELLYEGDSLSDILEQVQQIDMLESTFKVIFVKTNDLEVSEKIEFPERRAIEREMGLHITGESDVHHPDHEFGLVTLGGRWFFGHYVKNKAVWLHHMKKPRSYSIALSTRVARAVANIAVPHPLGITAIDPCCGIGTVLVEALSMGIDIVGGDINPFVVHGARENLAYFELEGEITLGAISQISSHYDVAIIDMPYNLFSITTPEEQLSILKHTRRIATKAIIITIETIDAMIADAGLTITDRCVAKKGNFTRQILVCA
ncbi:RNA methyltransferase [Brevibacterium sp. JNUCC-42]|nr:RNA methyltransferase [Brevibacterium sp. JNUCC-42]